MSQKAIERWERSFRAAAMGDGYAILRDHLRRLELPDSPELLLEGTILAVRAGCLYMDLDNLDSKYFEKLLEMQQYDPADSSNVRYAYTFDICGDTYARVLAESGSKAPDLADLYGHPWEDYKVAVFTHLYITRTDWSGLSSGELRQLEDDVTADIRYDYCEEEVDILFDEVDFLVGWPERREISHDSRSRHRRPRSVGPRSRLWDLNPSGNFAWRVTSSPVPPATCTSP